MLNSRRHFLSRVSAALAAVSAACRKTAPPASAPPAGAPPAFGTAPDVGPPVSPATFVEVEKLVQFDLKPAEREQAAGNWRKSMAPLYERRTGPRKFLPASNVAPATRWDPMLPGLPAPPSRDRFIRSAAAAVPLPANDADIAFAPLTQLSRWVEARQLTSARLTNTYLDRLQRFDPKLRCVITLTRERALRQAEAADREIAAGVVFWGYVQAGALIGVMGLQTVRDVDLIRHAYVLPNRQGQGIGGALLDQLRRQGTRRMLVGTWAAADWAIRFYQQHGFELVSPSRKTALLNAYWSVPNRQIDTSVVLAGSQMDIDGPP